MEKTDRRVRPEWYSLNRSQKDTFNLVSEQKTISESVFL